MRNVTQSQMVAMMITTFSGLGTWWRFAREDLARNFKYAEDPVEKDPPKAEPAAPTP